MADTHMLTDHEHWISDLLKQGLQSSSLPVFQSPRNISGFLHSGIHIQIELDYAEITSIYEWFF